MIIMHFIYYSLRDVLNLSMHDVVMIIHPENFKKGSWLNMWYAIAAAILTTDETSMLITILILHHMQ